MAGRSKSSVWRHFKRDEKNPSFATCLSCKKQYKTSGNTSNLKDHLKRFHPFQKSNSTDEDVEDDVCLIEEGSSSSNIASCSSSETSNKKKARPSKGIKHGIKLYLDRGKKYDDKSDIKRKIDEALVKMIATDLEPFTMVEREGFRNFVSVIDSKYELPSKTHLKNNFFPQYHNQLEEKLKTLLNKVKYVAITCDVWTSPSTEGYLTITCHFIHSASLCSAVLKTSCLTGSHTAEAIAGDVRLSLEEWGILSKVVCIVTDSGSNMIAAAGLLKIKHLPCFAHMLNLVVSDALKNNEVAVVIKKVKAIVNYFRSSTLASDKLRETQTSLSKKILKLINDTPTRWNSTLFMIRRILEVGDSLVLAMSSLKNSPPQLSAEDNALLKDMVEALSPFEEATEQISGDQYATASLINPLVIGLFNHLSEVEMTMTTEEGNILLHSLIRSVNQRLFPYETSAVPSLATLLDPRYKKFGFRQPTNVTTAVKLLTSEITSAVKVNKIQPPPSQASASTSAVAESEETPQKKKKINLLGYVHKLAAEQLQTPPTTDAIIIVRQYTENKVIDHKENVLQFWQDNSNKELADIAKKYLCVPATSVPAERVFSKAGLILSSQRNRLKPKVVDKLIFCKSNLWLLNV
ncbi:E3 SUMO-protein ligase ZBED1-like [Nilaparvata lugens]|uniref:E3 SUMO-protein ligase ZBED1-like n=1 Tax=Nilaparvata lugens TaxID=108931 RepID=UPI00193D682E|nr:E3 SUMO-protein ligase ZBED1-like [Nilaparvata lugens]